MTLATARAGLTYPVQLDNNDVATHMQTLAQNVDDAMAMCAQGLIASRPAAGKVRRLYWATDDRGGKLSYDDGTTWRDIGPSPVTGPATGYTGLIVSAPSAALADTTLIVRSKASQTGPILAVQDSTPYNHLVMTSDGAVGIVGSTPSKSLVVSSSNMGPNASTGISFAPLSVLNFTSSTVPYIAMYNDTPGKAMAWGLDGSGNAVLGSTVTTGVFTAQALVVAYSATSPTPSLTLNTGDLLVSAGAVKAVGTTGFPPRFYLKQNSSALDAKIWDWMPTGNTLLGRAWNDAETISTSWLTVTRSGTTISSVALAGHLNLTGDVSTGLGAGYIPSGISAWGAGLTVVQDAVAPQGGVTSGIAVAVNRPAPAMTVTNGGGDLYQGYGDGYALRFRVGHIGDTVIDAGAGGVASHILHVNGSANAGYAGLWISNNFGNGVGGDPLRIDNSAGTTFKVDAYGRINWPQAGTSGIVSTTASGGGASALPANPVGYLQILLAGTTYKVPYYAI